MRCTLVTVLESHNSFRNTTWLLNCTMSGPGSAQTRLSITVKQSFSKKTKTKPALAKKKVTFSVSEIHVVSQFYK